MNASSPASTDLSGSPVVADLSGSSVVVADLSGSSVVVADLSGSPVVADLSGGSIVVQAADATEEDEPPRTAQIVGTATAAALPLLATLLGVVSPPIGFLMALAAPTLVAGMLERSTSSNDKKKDDE